MYVPAATSVPSTYLFLLSYLSANYICACKIWTTHSSQQKNYIATNCSALQYSSWVFQNKSYHAGDSGYGVLTAWPPSTRWSASAQAHHPPRSTPAVIKEHVVLAAGFLHIWSQTVTLMACGSINFTPSTWHIPVICDNCLTTWTTPRVVLTCKCNKFELQVKSCTLKTRHLNDMDFTFVNQPCCSIFQRHNDSRMWQSITQTATWWSQRSVHPSSTDNTLVV